MKKHKLMNFILPFTLGSIVGLIPLSFIELINAMLKYINITLSQSFFISLGLISKIQLALVLFIH